MVDTNERERRIAVMSGVSKRLFMAMRDLALSPPQVEDALFQMASVVDSTSKIYFPTTCSRDRFIDYVDSIMTDLFQVASIGRAKIEDIHFIHRDGNHRSLGEVLFKIRCSSYHDPDEVDQIIHWGNDNQVGMLNDKFIVSHAMLTALLLLLISDNANRDRIDTSVFVDDNHILIKGKKYPFTSFIGNRPALLALFE